MNKKILAIIPARGGSKSVPLKNMHQLKGVPLIDYTIDVAKKSDVFAKIICSTDSTIIRDHCLGKQIDVHARPAELGEDNSPVTDCVVHLLREQEKSGPLPDMIALLQATSPFLLASQIQEAWLLIQNDYNASSLQTVTTCPHNSHTLNQRMIKDGYASFRFKT